MLLLLLKLSAFVVPALAAGYVAVSLAAGDCSLLMVVAVADFHAVVFACVVGVDCYSWWLA